jgi:predicted amidohydrolase
MKAALISNPITQDIDLNLKNIIAMSYKAAANGAELILFPEAAVSGLINNDDPSHDLQIGAEMSSPLITRFQELTRELKVWLGIGFLEREGNKLFDSAILLSPLGEVALHYRRISPRWHGAKADPLVYCQGTDMPIADTPFGKIAFLICGDLFDDKIIDKLAGPKIAYVLFPFARCFDDKAIDQRRWDDIDIHEYLRQVEKIGITTLMANYVAGDGLDDDGSFGGAFVVDQKGNLINSLPLGKPDILIVEL